MEIIHSNRQIGSIDPSRTVGPTFQRGFDLISVGIPLDLRFEGSSVDRRWVLTDLNVDIFVPGADGSTSLLGHGFHAESLMPATTAMELSRCLNVRCSPRGLAQYELFRNGGPVRLRCEVRGKIFSLLTANQEQYLANPAPVVGALDIEFSREEWTIALRSCGLSASVLVEIPHPSPHVGKPDDGLIALLDAFEAFDHGGATAWKNCVGHIRPYLEEWRNREPLHGTEPKDGSAADRTWKLLNLRDALYKCCHFWVHESKSACTRDDAQLAIATYASLLRTIRP